MHLGIYENPTTHKTQAPSYRLSTGVIGSQSMCIVSIRKSTRIPLYDCCILQYRYRYPAEPAEPKARRSTTSPCSILKDQKLELGRWQFEPFVAWMSLVVGMLPPLALIGGDETRRLDAGPLQLTC